MSDSELVKASSDSQGIVTLTLSREKALNALNGELLERLSFRIREAASESAAKARVILLRGEGEKAFVAGADIKVMFSGDAAQVKTFLRLGQRVMHEIASCPIPVISVIHGVAFGGGLELALASDLIIATDSARFGQPEVKLGLIPGFGGTQRLNLRIGLGATKRLILTGDDIDAAEAHRLGIVDYITTNDGLESVVKKVSSSIASRAPLAVRAAKRAINYLHADAEHAGLNFEIEQFMDVFKSNDTREGLAAFVEKRAASFAGL